MEFSNLEGEGKRTADGEAEAEHILVFVQLSFKLVRVLCYKFSKMCVCVWGGGGGVVGRCQHVSQCSFCIIRSHT